MGANQIDFMDRHSRRSAESLPQVPLCVKRPARSCFADSLALDGTVGTSANHFLRVCGTGYQLSLTSSDHSLKSGVWLILFRSTSLRMRRYSPHGLLPKSGKYFTVFVKEVFGKLRKTP